MPEGRGSAESRSFCVSQWSGFSRVHLEEEWRLMFLSIDNEVCRAWLANALRRARPEGRTKMLGYLEAVLEEVDFEMNVVPGSQPAARKTSRKASRRREEGACSGCWGQRAPEHHLDRSGQPSSVVL